MAYDAIISKDPAVANALMLFHQNVHALKVQGQDFLGLSLCRNHIENMDAKYGPVGIPALLEAYGASYLTKAGSSKGQPSVKQWKMAKTMLGRDHGLQITMGYYAETMRILDEVFVYCLESAKSEAPKYREEFDDLEVRFVKSFMLLNQGADQPSASAIFAEAMRLAQDAIEEARRPLAHVKASAVPTRPYWTQQQTVEHSGLKQAAMRRYFDRMLDLPRFRRPVEALVAQLKEERGIDVDTRFRGSLKPVIVAAYPYAEALFYPSHVRDGMPLTRSPVHRSTVAKLERALSPVDRPYDGWERPAGTSERIPRYKTEAMVDTAHSLAGAQKKVGCMIGAGEAVFNAVGEGRALSQEEHRGLPTPAQRIAADMVAAGLAPSQEKALAFVEEAAKIAQEELRGRGQGVSGR